MGTGEHDRLRSLVDLHGRAVSAYVRRRLIPLSSADVDDLVEDTFIVVWRRIRDVPTGEAERPWILGVTRNVLRNAHRGARRRLRNEGTLRMARSGRRVAASAEDEATASLAFDRALSSLTSSDRELLTLHYWDGIDVPGLAVAMNVAHNAAATRLARAKSRFESAYSADEPSNSGALTDKERR